MSRVLIVEDKPALRAMLSRLLADRHTVDVAADGAEGLSRVEAGAYDLVITDVRLPGADGFAVLDRVRALSPETEVILMTAYATVAAAVEAVKAGAYDYIAKPFEPDALLLKVERALERRALRARARQAEAALARAGLDDEEMLGDSPAMRQVRTLIERVAGLDVTVLLTGESGTGKELAARAIHRAGRGGRPFVAVNCGAIPAQLLESELFGHAKGAFTGADTARTGLFEEAADGTLFLDEIGDMPLDLQVKLNRTLQEYTWRRVGEARERRLRARIIGATHRDLKAGIEAGRFREDLYFRLAVYPIALPPLRERGDDLFALAARFLATAARRFGRPVEGFTADALEALAGHRWPGNVRELAHAVERAVIVADGQRIAAADLPESVRPAGEAPGEGRTLGDMSYREAMAWSRERAVRAYVDAVLRRHDGNVTRAAEQAGIERESLHRLMRKAGLDADRYR